MKPGNGMSNNWSRLYADIIGHEVAVIFWTLPYKGSGHCAYFIELFKTRQDRKNYARNTGLQLTGMFCVSYTIHNIPLQKCRRVYDDFN